MKTNDLEKFKDILGWVARNFKKTLSDIECDDAWNDLNAYPIEAIERAAAYIRTNLKFYPCFADWKGALSATYKHETYKALSEPEPPPNKLRALWARVWVQMLVDQMNAEDSDKFPDQSTDRAGWDAAVKKYLLDGGIPQGMIDKSYPESELPI